MTLAEELERIATQAGADAVLAAEAQPGERIYVCAFEEGDGRTWIALDRTATRSRSGSASATPSRSWRSASSRRRRLRAATSTSSARSSRRARDREPARDRGGRGGGARAPARARRSADAGDTGRLDEIGAARTLEVALGGAAQGSPFAAAMKSAGEVVDALVADVERSYRIPLS